MGCVPFHIGFLRLDGASCESLSHASGVPAPTGREPRRAAGVDACTVPMFSFPILLGNDTGRVREVTNCRKPPAFAGGLFL